MNEERRPKAAPESTATTTSTMVARRRWAYSLMRRCESPCPPYGSPEWVALPDDSPYKVGSCVQAAEAWATDGDNLVEDLARELDDRRRLDKIAEDADYQANASRHRREWAQLRLVADWRREPVTPRPLEQIAADYHMRAGRQGGGPDVG